MQRRAWYEGEVKKRDLQVKDRELIHDLLRPQFPGFNHKRVYHLYRQVNLAMRRRKKSKRPINERVPLQLARTVNKVWSMDFVSDSLSGGRRLKYLTVTDDFSHESVDIVVDFGISRQYVTRVLDNAALFCGWPNADYFALGGQSPYAAAVDGLLLHLLNNFKWLKK